MALGAISNKADFYEMKGAADALLSGLGIDDFYYKDHDNRVAEVHVDGKVIGHIDTNSFEFDLTSWLNWPMNRRSMLRFPSTRPSSRDIAVFVPLNEKVENVLDIIENTARKTLVETDLFDIYEKQRTKSLAFHLIFQSTEKTLTDEDVNAIMEKIFETIGSQRRLGSKKVNDWNLSDFVLYLNING